MTTITIPKSQSKNGDLVAIPREEYEELMHLKKIIPMFKPTKAERNAIARGERAVRQGQFKPWSEVKNELAGIRHRSRAKTTE